MKIAIEGCCHGQLPTIYSTIETLESTGKYKVDLLLICGDFQAIRNERDLQCMAVPDKYKELGEFYQYYTGEKRAPVLTIVIGGNHEASNYLWELFHGGWLAPNIYFLGHAGSVLVNGARISGASGIFKGYNFHKGYFERQPYSKDDLRSIYHIRESAIRQLSLLPSPLTIFLSHDWPLNITSFAPPSSVAQLLRKKPYFKQEVAEGKLGSPPLLGLLKVLRPKWWFSAHLHVGFDVKVWWETEVPREEKVKNPDEIVIENEEPAQTNPDEIMLNDLEGEDFDVAAVPPSVTDPSPWFTQFIALDKCLPKRKFLEVIDVDTPGISSAPILTFDPHWLAITKAFHSHISLSQRQTPFPPEDAAKRMVEESLEWVRQNVPDEGKVRIEDVQQFVKTASGPNSETAGKDKPPVYSNPQTEAFCRMLKVSNFVNPDGITVEM